MSRTLTVAALLSLLSATPAPAEGTNSTSGHDYPSFRLIAERNIFDPNRSGKTNGAAAAAPDRKSTTESFSLLGTMSYEKGSFAFFDGSSSRYRTVLGTSNQIAGYTVTAISPARVRLETTNSQPVELAVGAQMKRVDDGEWQWVGGSTSKEDPSASRPTGEKAATTTGTPSNDNADEVLKKLMQRREQELKK